MLLYFERKKILTVDGRRVGLECAQRGLARHQVTGAALERKLYQAIGAVRNLSAVGNFWRRRVAAYEVGSRFDDVIQPSPIQVAVVGFVHGLGGVGTGEAAGGACV